MKNKKSLSDILGPNPGIEARQVLNDDSELVFVRYEWIKNWSSVYEFEFIDGQEGIII